MLKSSASSTSNTSQHESLNDDKKNIQGKVRKVLLDNQKAELFKSVGELQIIKESDKHDKVENKFQVENVFVTEDVMKSIRAIDEKIEEADILKFLRCMSALNEDEYNELYLLGTPRDDRFFVLPGDKITPNNIELFDVLIRDNASNRTYLFQNKKGFDNVTRDACGQLRNSADVLWHDFVNGRKTHIELFWKIAMSDTAESVYRKLLKEKLLELEKDKFMEAFKPDAVIVFVLSIALPKTRQNALLNEVHPITEQWLQDNKMKVELLQQLKNKGLLNSRGFLTDAFIKLTEEEFVAECNSIRQSFGRSFETTARSLYKLLKKEGMLNLSTVAKQQVLSLFDYFGRFHIGHKPHFELKLHVIDAD